MKKMFGRRIIYSDETFITNENVVDVLGKALPIHRKNICDISYLYDYYKGKQPSLNRTKAIREDINNRVVENRANEIVSFKTGYLVGEPIQYVSHSSEEEISESIMKLNRMMETVNKSTLDKSLIDWNHIAGTAYRIALPIPNGKSIKDEGTAFRLYSIDPREAFVIYSSDIEKKPLAGCYIGKTREGKEIVSVYTDTEFFEVVQSEIVRSEPNTIGMIPIVEYPANDARLGAFEIVLTVLDAMNEVECNRMDAIQQFVQAFMKFVNCDIDEESFEEFKKKGAIKIVSKDGQAADVDIVSREMDQTQTQVLMDYMYQTVLTICGMPNRNGGSSTSDTGSAVVLRDGWSSAETRAKDSELMFKKSERQMLKVVLRICGVSEESGINLSISEIDIKFTRRNYENIETKSQVLVSMLNNDKIHPKLAFTHCGMFTDAEEAYKISEEHYNDVLSEMEKTLDKGTALNQ